NIAEDRDQVRRRRQLRSELGAAPPGSLPHAVQALKESSPGSPDIPAILRASCIVPVLTAHPTEVQRRSTLDLHRAIARSLRKQGSCLDAVEASRRHEELAGLIATLWQTRMLRQTK